MIDKQVYILRGLPSSGKSTFAKSLQELHRGNVFSTDNFYMINGEYKWEGALICDAHKWNQLCFLKAAREGHPVLVVDNTNTTYKELEPYVKIAYRYGYNIQVIEPTTPWAFDVQECAKRNTHGFHIEGIQRMKDRWEPYEVVMDKIAGFIKSERALQTILHVVSPILQDGQDKIALSDIEYKLGFEPLQIILNETTVTDCASVEGGFLHLMKRV